MLLRLLTTSALVHAVVMASFAVAVVALGFYHLGRR